MNPFPDFAPDDERNEDVPSGPFSARLILVSALAGLSPVAVLGALLWWGLR